MDLHDRLAEFFRRLEAAPPVGNAEDALNLVCRLIEEVEDQLCPVQRVTPPPLHFTGRMYPPMRDMVRRLADGTIVADTRHHRIDCRSNGSITIVHVPSQTIMLEKAGHERAK